MRLVVDLSRMVNPQAKYFLEYRVSFEAKNKEMRRRKIDYLATQAGPLSLA